MFILLSKNTRNFTIKCHWPKTSDEKTIKSNFVDWCFFFFWEHNFLSFFKIHYRKINFALPWLLTYQKTFLLFLFEWLVIFFEPVGTYSYLLYTLCFTLFDSNRIKIITFTSHSTKNPRGKYRTLMLKN